MIQSTLLGLRSTTQNKTPVTFEYFSDTVTPDELTVLDPCSTMFSATTQCIDVCSTYLCITSTVSSISATVSSTSATVSTINIDTHLMSPVKVSMVSSTKSSKVSSSLAASSTYVPLLPQFQVQCTSTQSTLVVGTAAV